jgi:hypothetical protein
MGALNFHVPQQLNAEDVRALARSYLMGGAEYMPWLTEVRQQPGHLAVRTHINESGCLCAPWQVNGHGRLVLATATLMNRTAPYQLALELARGKVNHLRAQAADWEAGSLHIGPELAEKLRGAAVTFARAACSQETPAESLRLAEEAINEAVRAGDALVQTYVDQVFQLRQQREPKLGTSLSCRIIGSPPDAQQTGLIQQAFNTVQIPLSWPMIEPTESAYLWDEHDALFHWAQDAGLRVVGGPIIDFSAHGLPAWMAQYQSDLRRIINCMDDYVEMVIQRYGEHVKTWQLTAASNWPGVLGLGKDELLRLTNRLHDTAQQLNPELALILGIAQPWGECLTQEEKAYFPFMFADTLLRNRARVNSLDLEILMGIGGRGSYARDLLEVSRILDVYALLSLPIRVTLACPSALAADPQADQAYPVESRGSDPDWSPAVQGQWAEQFGALAVCKPYVEGVTWAHFSDAQPHQFPHCGLVDTAGKPKPALEPLRKLRQAYLV